MNNPLLNGLLIFSILLALAWVGGDILLPVIFAFLLWVIITAWNKQFAKITFHGKFIPRRLQNALSFIAFIGILFVLANLLAFDLQQFSNVYPELEANLEERAISIEAAIGINLTALVEDNLATVDFQSVAANVANAATSLSTTIFTVLVYLLYIFGEQKYAQAKLKAASGDEYESQHALFSDIIASIEQYISIKTAISALTGLLSYGVMLAVGLEFAFVWAFIIFIMNFIPSIGSIIATIFPVAFAFVSFSTWWPALVLLIVIGAIQLYVGNVLEPKYLGKKLNVSSLLLFFSLFFWGAIWGIPGMFISVPLTVIIMIVLSRIPATRSIGIWMSGDGVV
ncbi:MAG: AI-2E family transporter [Patescibacteria group bacterium]